MRPIRADRHGMTLIELLAVITILVLLIAVAIPVMRPALKDRKLREASRQINTFCTVAKAKAAETGRPWGVAIVRNPNAADSSFQLFLAETPIPFAGETYAEKAKLTSVSNVLATAEFFDSQDLVQIGDSIQFDYKGPHYPIRGVSGTSPKTVTFEKVSGQPMPAISSDAAYPTQVPFQVFRGPIVTNQSLQLPTGIVIDLAYSGLGPSGFELASSVVPARPMIITFTPNGSVDRLVNVPYTVPGTIHLLVGRIDQVPSLEPDSSKHNLADPSASWVSIGHLTGTVTTAENYIVDPIAISAATSRTIAQSKQTMGGR